MSNQESSNADMIEGRANSSNGMTISFCINKMEFEFRLPQNRGGPLVVPFINYNKYSPY